MIFSPINYSSSLKGLSVYKVLVFTKFSFEKIIGEKGETYLLDMFLDVCKEKGCHFMGLRVEGGYVYALIGFGYDKSRKPATGVQQRCCSTC